MPVPRRAAYRVDKVIWSALDWLYPPYCGGCGQKGMRWCLDCQQKIHVIRPPVCPKCGDSQTPARLCFSCKTTQPCYDNLRSWAYFDGPVRNAIHRLKYKRDVALGDVLSNHLVSLLKELCWPVDLVIPVPLGVARLNERGYNQSALLARPIALEMRLDYQPKALERIRETRSQVDLNAAERRDNVAGAFRASHAAVNGRQILVVDDVTTSGATLDACSAALKEAGARRVYGITLTRALYKGKRSF